MPNIKTLPDGKRIIDTGLPQRQIKQLWLELHKETYIKILDTIAISQPKDKQVVRMIKFAVSSILDEDAREEAKAKVNKLIETRLKHLEENGGRSTALDAEAIEEAYIEIMENVTDYVDTAFGVSHRLGIGIT